MRKKSGGKKTISESENKTIGQCVDAILRMEEGVKFFAHIHNFCEFARSGLAYNQQTKCIDTVTSALNEARRGVYIHMRALASQELLAKAEELAERQVHAVQPTEEERNT